ncbi:protein ROOT PRIMORDIUM DEFECTIVE 1 [Zingiber officinale]|nr:protein ROOT PRIMORDIUM DEFECTIVE 1 [Zingiber officinale]
MAGGAFAAAARLPTLFRRFKVTSAQHVAARHLDPTFEKLMEGYKHLLKAVAVQDLILASPAASLPFPLLSSAAPRLHLSRGAAYFVRAFPRVFSLVYDPFASQPVVRLTPAAARIASDESAASSASDAADRLRRLLCISSSRCLPLRAIFKVWRELGLPDDFEDSVIARNPTVFALRTNPREPNTHLLELIDQPPASKFISAAEDRRRRDHGSAEDPDWKFAFKLGFPPGMKLTKNYRAKLKQWQRLAYLDPYGNGAAAKQATAREKRAVAIAHEFLSLTVEKMAEVEKVSQFRNWMGMDLNIRDLFLDHPGIFYLSTKGKRHTVFLREAYERGRLIDPNPIYEARRRLLELVLMRRRGMGGDGREEEEKEEEG